jgi:predicted ferric reductase
MSKSALKIALLLAAYLALVLLPLALGAAQSLPRRPWRDELSSGLAMVAFAMLLVEFLLSGRNRAISARIGMDLTMRFHQMMAFAMVALLAVHPLLYSLPYGAPRPWDTQRLLTVTLTPSATVTGVLAWMLLPVLVAMAFFRNHFRYETWRLTHGLLAAAVAVLGTHHAIATGRYAQDPAMRALWIAACGLALASLAYAYLFKPLLLSRRRYRVASVAPEAERIWRVVLEPDSRRPFRFTAGQFVWLKLFRSFGRITEHPFSISSAPAQLPRVEFLIKEAGDFTAAIGELPVGTAAYLDGPYGNFTVAGRGGDGVMLIAGGVGIAPIAGIAADLAARRPGWPVRLLYADRTDRQFAARRELDALSRSGSVSVEYVIAEPAPGWTGLRGLVDVDNLKACLPREGAERWLYLVCGPPAMIDAVELNLSRLGVPLTSIVSERFRYDTGVVTPRERLTRAVIVGLVAAQVVAALAFAIW